jgi:hypothetical protein
MERAIESRPDGREVMSTAAGQSSTPRKTGRDDIIVAGTKSMPLNDILKTAVRRGVEDALADDLQEMVAKETRRVLRDREDQLVAIVRAAVADAMTELLS